MPRAPRAPRGYKEFDYPLFHHIEFEFGLRTYSVVGNSSTMLPLFYHDNEVIASPSTTAVNPKHASFSETSELGVLSGCIVPKVNFNFSATLTKGAIETDKIRTIHMKWYPIYIAFLENLDAFDELTGTDIESILDLTHDTTDEVTIPNWNGTDTDSSWTMPTSVQGLTTTQESECITRAQAQRNVLYQAMKYYSNGGKLRKSIGKIHHVTINRDRPYRFNSNNFTAPKVKSGNPYMFCGILYELDETDQHNSILKTAEVTNIEHVRVNGSIDFQEWSHMFNQDTE